jgi:hypothetical protein
MIRVIAHDFCARYGRYFLCEIDCRACLQAVILGAAPKHSKEKLKSNSEDGTKVKFRVRELNLYG